jgi:hypothetical protein
VGGDDRRGQAAEIGRVSRFFSACSLGSVTLFVLNIKKMDEKLQRYQNDRNA